MDMARINFFFEREMIGFFKKFLQDSSVEIRIV